MNIYKNGKQFEENWRYNTLKHQPYAYKRKGIINKVLSNKIYDTKNTLLKAVLNVYEGILQFWFDSVDVLGHYINYREKNR